MYLLPTIVQTQLMSELEKQVRLEHGSDYIFPEHSSTLLPVNSSFKHQLNFFIKKHSSVNAPLICFLHLYPYSHTHLKRKARLNWKKVRRKTRRGTKVGIHHLCFMMVSVERPRGHLEILMSAPRNVLWDGRDVGK